MSLTEVTEILQQMLFTTLLVMAPMLIASLVVGLGISILQAATQIHEQTLTFIPKMIGVVLAVLIALPWMLRLMVGYASELLGNLGAFV